MVKKKTTIEAAVVDWWNYSTGKWKKEQVEDDLTSRIPGFRYFIPIICSPFRGVRGLQFRDTVIPTLQSTLLYL